MQILKLCMIVALAIAMVGGAFTIRNGWHYWAYVMALAALIILIFHSNRFF